MKVIDARIKEPGGVEVASLRPSDVAEVLPADNLPFWIKPGDVLISTNRSIRDDKSVRCTVCIFPNDRTYGDIPDDIRVRPLPCELIIR